MKYKICEVCGEPICYGNHVWRVDSVFEQDYIYCCQDCAELYYGYPESLSRVTGDLYDSLKWKEITRDYTGLQK